MKTEQELIHDIEMLQDTKKYCDLAIARRSFVLECMMRERHGVNLSDDEKNLRDKVLQFPILRFPVVKRSKEQSGETILNAFLEVVGDNQFKVAEVVRFSNGVRDHATISRVIRDAHNNGKLISVGRCRYKAA